MNKSNKQTKNTNAGTRPARGTVPKKGGKKPPQQQQIQVMAPAAYSRRPQGISSPRERSGKLGSRMIRYKEYVQDIAGSVAFATTTFACNPGLSNLFAWLAGQSLFYQEYVMKSLSFSFETEKATSTSGKIMFAFLQDSSDPAPATKQEMLENLLKASGAAWQPFKLNISMANFAALGRSRFIRSGNLAANLDVKTYDIGQLIVAVSGMADTSAVGELYIEYELELKTPLQSAAQLAAALSITLTGASPSQTSMLGVTPTFVGGLNVTATGNTLTFNSVGQYLVSFQVNGTGLFTSYMPTLTGTAAVSVDQAGISNAAANAGTKALGEITVTITSRGQTLIIDNSGVATTISASIVAVTVAAAANGW